MPPRVEWSIPPLPGYPDAWRWDERGAPPPPDTTLTWVGARGVTARVDAARRGSERLFIGEELVASGSGELRLPDTLLDSVGWHRLRVEAVDADTGAPFSASHELGVVLDVPVGAWSLPVAAPPLRPWVRAARLAATLGAGAQEHLSLLTTIVRALHRGVPSRSRRSIQPTYAPDPRYLPDINPPWDLQGFLDWLDAEAAGEFPLACDGAVALLALLGTVLGAEAGATRLQTRQPGQRIRFTPFHLFGTRATTTAPSSVHQLVVVGRGANNPIVLDPTLDWDDRGVDPPLPLRLYLSRHLTEPVDLIVAPPVWALADPTALSDATARRERATPTAEVAETQRALAAWALEDPETRAVWDTTRGSGGTFRILDRRERCWGVVNLPEQMGAGILALPPVEPRVLGVLPTTLPDYLRARWA